MKNHTLDSHLKALADAICQRFFDQDYFPDRRHIRESMAGRVIHSIFALERAGFNTGDKDWVAAIESERFTVGKQTVALILAYPSIDDGYEPKKLARELFIGDGDHDHCLYCAVYWDTIPKEQLERAVWREVAMIAKSVRDEARTETFV